MEEEEDSQRKICADCEFKCSADYSKDFAFVMSDSWGERERGSPCLYTYILIVDIQILTNTFIIIFIV